MKVAQLCPTLCDPMDYTVHGILQARILGWVAFPFARGSSQPRDELRSPLHMFHLPCYHHPPPQWDICYSWPTGIGTVYRPQCMVYLRVGGVHSLHLDKCVVACIHHGVSTFTALKILCALPVYPFPPHPNLGNPFLLSS